MMVEVGSCFRQGHPCKVTYGVGKSCVRLRMRKTASQHPRFGHPKPQNLDISYYFQSRDRTTTSYVMPNICIILYWHVRFISDNLFRRIIVLLSSSWHSETAELFSESSQRTPRGGESSSSACTHYLIFTSRLVFTPRLVCTPCLLYTPRLHLNNPD